MVHRSSSTDGDTPASALARPQTDLFDDSGPVGWPAVSDFPYNQDRLTVGSVIRKDLALSPSPLVITGYASLEQLIEWLAECQSARTSRSHRLERVRLLLGHEPYPTTRNAWRGRRYRPSQEVRDYWLREGVSLLLSGKILTVLELLHDGILEIRTSGDRPVHAKIYVGNDAVTIGSSNFSRSGLVEQVEANVRFVRTKGQDRFDEAVRLAESIWREGHDYAAEFEQLLRALLRKVSWQEALSRACAELLEGTWADRYAIGTGLYEGPPLWPSQEQGIAHALWILENQGSVLVADATGSGKTLMGVHLVKRIMNRIWRTGRARTDLAVLMAPPSILSSWDREAIACGLALEKYSQGHLSRSHGTAQATLRTAVRRAQLLIIDEAHNFLRRSNRTRALYSNMADHVLLFTATPINRGPEDLLAIVDLLGADNLDDETLTAVEVLWRRHRHIQDRSHDAELEQLRRAIRQFTVRRTKTDLNHLVDREPARYRSAITGRACRYPQHRPVGYELHETDADRRLAVEIREIAERLRGLSRLTAPIELPSSLALEGMSEESYIDQRLRSAAALARHEVAAALRSSKARLLEHLRGTKAAIAATPRLAGTKLTAEKDGVVQRTMGIAGKPPLVRVAAPVPEWLSSSRTHEIACQEEIALYERIEELARQLSDARESAKADTLVRLVNEHSLVLAFDSYLITLHDLRARIQAHPEFQPGHEVIVATGGSHGARKRLCQEFGPGSDATKIIALCSDALSESVNLQAASTVVMLDTPSVIRIAEQRIGRVDRMDSPHDVVHAYWPVDAEEFALKASERLIERHKMVHDHLGSNLPLPPSMTSMPSDEVVRYEDYVAELKENEARREARADLQDAFAPVRALIEGTSALVPASVYEMMRGSKERVLSSVGVVRSAEAFGFIAVAGTDYGAPKWVYLESASSKPLIDLDTICAALRRHLENGLPDAPFDSHAAGVLERMLRQLALHEEVLLPRAKQRALQELRRVCRKYRKSAESDDERVAVLDDILRFAGSVDEPGEADRAALAAWWLRIIHPLRHQHLSDRKRRRPVLLKDLRRDLLASPLTTEQLLSVYDEHLVAIPVERRVVAAIIGVPEQ